jgi:surfeit locus 1 family protein
VLHARLGEREFAASWWMALLCLAGVALFTQLGRWQWHRAAEKRALDDRFRSGTEQVMELGERSTAALPRYQRVRVSGSYDTAHQFLLDNLSHAGRAGVEVLTPLQLADGRTLLVNRGWVPWGATRAVLPAVDFASARSATIVGRLDELPVTGLALGHAAPEPGVSWPKLTSFPHMPELAAVLGGALEPQQLLLDAGAADGYVRDWQPTGLGATRHIAYALQWWAFAALAVTLFVVLNLRRATPASRSC